MPRYDNYRFVLITISVSCADLSPPPLNTIQHTDLYNHNLALFIHSYHGSNHRDRTNNPLEK